MRGATQVKHHTVPPAVSTSLQLPLARLCFSYHSPHFQRPGTMRPPKPHVSQGHSKRLLCSQGGRKPAIAPFPPSPDPWEQHSTGEGLHFLTRSLFPGHQENSPVLAVQLPPPCQVSVQCIARDCPPASWSRQQRQTHIQVQNLFPNTSFMSFSHEIFISEYSLHLENRRDFFLRHIRL